jgi:ankyrin repeat protein
MRVFTLLLLVAASSMAASRLLTAIRSGDVRAVKAQLGAGVSLDTPADEGLTPLMYAVMTAGPPVMRALLDAGAGVNTSNAEGITALHMAAFDLEKTRLLIERGANVNAATQAGETPLIIAADRPGSSEIIALLIAKGADPSARPPSGFTALLRAAYSGDAAAMRLLTANGVKVADNPDLARSAAFGHCRECLEIALTGGASPNGARNRRTALQDAAAFGDLAMVRMLVEKGADIQAVDTRGYTALMRAALSYEPGAAQVVEYLLARGASTSLKNETGDTALSFALRFGETPIVAMLRKAGAPEAATVPLIPPPLAENSARAAIERSLPLLQRIGEPLSSAMKCTSCHHNSLPAMTVAMARTRGFAVDGASARKEYDTALALPKGRRNRTNLLGIGVPDINPYPLIGIAAENAAANPSTDAMVHHVSTRQERSGRFRGQDYRPPQEYTDITFTATALRAIQLHTLPGRSSEFKDRIQRATRWLAAATPRDTEDHALRLMGLSWGAASKPVRDSAVAALLALQRPDGGWGQTALLATDAYATGESLYALHLAGIPPSHAAYQRGIGYLLKNQRPDGSWPVISRSHPVQPLIDAGHPYGNHQWISASAGAWSTMALLATMPPAPVPPKPTH